MASKEGKMIGTTAKCGTNATPRRKMNCQFSKNQALETEGLGEGKDFPVCVSMSAIGVPASTGVIAPRCHDFLSNT